MGQVSPDKAAGRRHAVLESALLIAVTVLWVALDQTAKAAASALPEGGYGGSILGGLIEFRIVHNTGAAWGIFEGNPAALGAFSLVVCCLLLAYFAVSIRTINTVQTVGIALVAAGGIGNAIDRFSQGYVIDFFAATFIDFPVFNVADIGVTCGVVILLAGLALSWYREAKQGADR